MEKVQITKIKGISKANITKDSIEIKKILKKLDNLDEMDNCLETQIIKLRRNRILELIYDKKYLIGNENFSHRENQTQMSNKFYQILEQK